MSTTVLLGIVLVIGIAIGFGLRPVTGGNARRVLLIAGGVGLLVLAAVLIGMILLGQSLREMNAPAINTPNPEQVRASETTNASFYLTATALINRATETGEAQLAITQEPDAFQQTATALIAEATRGAEDRTEAAEDADENGDVSVFELTATALIIRATETAEASTPVDNPEGKTVFELTATALVDMVTQTAAASD